jgi:hypothetical protein
MGAAYEGNGTSGPGLTGTSTGGPGIVGTATSGPGVVGAFGPAALTAALAVTEDGVLGLSAVHGVHGVSGAPSVVTPPTDSGVFGESKSGFGVFGSSTSGEGVHGETPSSSAGVSGINTGSGPGVYGRNGSSITGASAKSCGVYGESDSGEGVHGETMAKEAAGVSGINTGGGTGVYGRSSGGSGDAGYFQGNVTVTGNLTSSDVKLSGGDCAEEFDVHASESIEPGSVVVFDEEGALTISQSAYDKRVVGVISGAGSFRPAVVMDRRISGRLRAPVALVGKVYCKVDASYGAVGLGDLLTTSPKPGWAMKAQDPVRAFGAVIGKAMAPLGEGAGLIPVLVALG